jgi:hypothetical protein
MVMSKTLKEIQQDEQFAKEQMGICINDLPQVIGGSINNFKLISFLADLHKEVEQLRKKVDEFIQNEKKGD